MTVRSTLDSPEVLFRYSIVSAVLALELQGFGRSDAVRLVAGQLHYSQGQARRVSERTLWRYLKAFEAEGVQGLLPASRGKLRGSRVLSPELVSFIGEQRESDRDASIPELIRRAREESIIGAQQPVDRTTVWRTMQRLDIATKPRKQPREDDARRYEFAHRMQMVLVDFKHFRAGRKRLKRVAVYFLDDATRYGLAVVVTTSELAEVVLLALHDVLCRYGRMDCLYWDRGPGFIADDVERVCAKLAVHAILGTARYPQARGKIERFNRSLKARTLRSLVGAAEVDPDCADLQLRLQHDLELYNHLPHEGLSGQTPHERWTASSRDLRPVATQQLADGFVLPLERRVSNDHIVRVDGHELEVPRGRAGERVTLWRRLLEKRPYGCALYLEHAGELVRLELVDKQHNAVSPRAHVPTVGDDTTSAPVKSASARSFERTYGSLLGPDGGFPDTHDNEE